MSTVSLNLKVHEESPELALRLEAELEDTTLLPQPLEIIAQLISDKDIAPFRWIWVNPDRILTRAVQKWRSLCENECFPHVTIGIARAPSAFLFYSPSILLDDILCYTSSYNSPLNGAAIPKYTKIPLRTSPIASQNPSHVQ
jgi:hypothetical protein